MNRKEVKKVVSTAIEHHHEQIYNQICLGYTKEPMSTGGIEQKFENALKNFVPIKASVSKPSLKELGSKQPPCSGREKGWIDIYIEEMACGLELKAVRLPRARFTGLSSRRYDYGQIASDYFRLSRAKRLRSSNLVVLIYGPLVEEASSALKVYQTYHNSMFLDAYIARNFAGQPNRDRSQHSALCKMGLLEPWLDARRYPECSFAVKHRKLGAVVIDCKHNDD